MRPRRKPEPGYSNQSARPFAEPATAPAARPALVPVVCPRPVFASPSEKLQWEYAVESTPRRPGEDVTAWLDRVALVGRPQGSLLP